MWSLHLPALMIVQKSFFFFLLLFCFKWRDDVEVVQCLFKTVNSPWKTQFVKFLTNFAQCLVVKFWMLNDEKKVFPEGVYILNQIPI